MSASGVEITQLLDRWKDGDRSVENELATRIYPVLRELARAHAGSASDGRPCCGPLRSRG